MELTNIFEAATRYKYRFPFKGMISVEDLWDLKLQDLDSVFKLLNKEKKQSDEESLLQVKSEADQELENKIQIVKFIVQVKQAETAERLAAKDKKERNQKIMRIIERKQNEALEGKSLEELTAMLELIKAIEYSFLRITAATFISGAIAFPIAILVYNSRIAKDILNPMISVMRYIPVTAFYPLLIMWFGIDEMMKIVFLFIATFVYMMPSVVLCLEEVNNDLIDTGLTIGMSKLQTIWRIQIPASLPGVLNSYIMMYGIGFTYIAVAETINAQYGLGYIIQQSSSRGRTDLVFMAIIVIMIISVIFDYVSKWLVKKIFKWRYIND